jgi:hypothetical protein
MRAYRTRFSIVYNCNMLRRTLLLVLALAAASSCLAQTIDLRGKWKADLTMPKSKTDDKDPMNKMGEAFAQMMLSMMGNIKLRIGDGNSYRLSMMGMPLDGHFTVAGSKLRFTPEKAMGMTAEQWRTIEANNKDKTKEQTFSSKDMQPTDATLSADGQTITFLGDKKDPTGSLSFHRVVEVPESSRPLTATSPQEQALVGHFNGTMNMPERPKGAKPLTQKEQEEAEMAKMMLSSLELDLHRDNTFEMNMMVAITGTWKVSGNVLTLTPTGMMGMEAGKDQSKKSNDITMTVSDGGQTLVGANDKDGTKITFKRGEPS